MIDIIDVFTKAVADDPKAAAVLMDEVAYSLMAEEAKAYGPLLDAAAYTEARKTLDRAKVGLARGYVSKAAGGTYPGAEMNQVGQWMAGIDAWLEQVAKDANEFAVRDGQRVRIRRNALGQFASIDSRASRVVVGQAEDSVAPVRPVRDRLEVTNAPNAAAGQPGTWSARDGSDPREADVLATFQGTAESAITEAKSMAARLGPAHVPGAVAVLQDKKGRKHSIALQALADGELPDGMNVRNPITGIRLDAVEEGSPAEQAISARGFNRMGLLERLLKPFDSGKEGYGGLLASRQPGDPRLDKFLARLQITGELLNTVDPTQKLQGPMVALVGSYGPEAVRVLTPQVQRTAYRYRGTERTPDAAITDWYTAENKDTVESAGDAIDDGKESARSIAAQIDRPEDADDPLLQSIKYRASTEHAESPISGDALRLGVRSDLAVAELLKTLPKNAMIGELSIKSGHVLPSQGVMIDRDGDVVAQAVGFSDDHYLPFNLKNMGDLRGGSYVRTRQQGGLTGEDIWASVFHGARSATVASSSGVFRIEFAPDFRGARAMSDKAFSMYDRYLQILNAVDESDLYMLDISGPEKEIIRRKVKAAHPELKSDALQTKITEAWNVSRDKQTSVTLTPDKLKVMNSEAKTEAAAELPQGTAQQLSRRTEELYNLKHDAARNAVVNQLNLNADGYQLALETLQQQFPYFIRTVEYEPLSGKEDNTRLAEGKKMTGTNRSDMGFLARRGLKTNVGPKPSRGTDSGYVKPGQLRRVQGTGNTIAGKPTETPPTPPAGAGGAVTPTTGTTPASAPAVPGTTPSVTAPTPDTTSHAARMAVIKGRVGQEEKKKLVDAFVSNMARLTNLYGENKHPSQNKNPLDASQQWPTANDAGQRSWENNTYDELVAARATDPLKIQWFIGQPTAEKMTAAFMDNSEEAFKLFNRATTNNIKSAMQTEWPAAGLQEIIDETDFFGSKTVDEAANRIKQAALDIVEFDTLSLAFVDNTPENVRASTAKAVSFDELTSLESADQVRSYAEANPEVAALAQVIGASDGKYSSMLRVASRMDRYLEALSKAPEVRDKVLALDDDSMKAAEKKNLRGIQQLADLGLSDEVLFNESEAPEWDDYYERLQKARTLIEVSRVLNAADFTGGEAKNLPKVTPPWVADPWPVKKAFVESFPVSKAVRARREAGLSRAPQGR